MCRYQAKRLGDMDYHRTGAVLKDHVRKLREAMIGRPHWSSRPRGTPGCNGSAEIGQTALLAKLVTENKDCKWIYRFWANPGMPRGGIVPPSPVLAPGSALGSRPRVALSSAQAPSM